MSIHLISEVWDHSESSGTARLVLLALADNADRQTRLAWPSVRDLSRRTRVSERSVQRALRELERLEEIKLVEAGGPPGRTAQYLVAPTGRQSGTTVPPKGDTDDEEGRHRGLRVVSPASPEPSNSNRQGTGSPVTRDKRMSHYDRGLRR